MKIVIDRFEADFAVCELPDRTMVNVPKVLFPNCFEGDVIDISPDSEETAKRKNLLKSKLNKLFD